MFYSRSDCNTFIYLKININYTVKKRQRKSCKKKKMYKILFALRIRDTIIEKRYICFAFQSHFEHFKKRAKKGEDKHVHIYSLINAFLLHIIPQDIAIIYF
jgi:hypothetical protein